MAGVVKECASEGQLLVLPKETADDTIQIQISNKAVVDLLKKVEIEDVG